jgi:hypothetical protein
MEMYICIGEVEDVLYFIHTETDDRYTKNISYGIIDFLNKRNLARNCSKLILYELSKDGVNVILFKKEMGVEDISIKDVESIYSTLINKKSNKRILCTYLYDRKSFISHRKNLMNNVYDKMYNELSRMGSYTINIETLTTVVY